MEKRCIKSVGIDREEYEKKANIIIESFKNLREELLALEDTPEKYNLLLNLLLAIDGLISNKEYFDMCLLLSVSTSEDYTTVTFYEPDELRTRIYGDVYLLPTFCIIANDLKSFYFVKEKGVLPNPDNGGRKINYEVSSYKIEDGKVNLNIVRNSDFAHRINDECLHNATNFVKSLKNK